MLEIKERLFRLCEQSIHQRLDVCENRIEKLQEDLQSETKSSAGDKHETGRAMLQLEREKLGSQLRIIERDLQFLKSIKVRECSQKIGVGCLVYTNLSNYFIAISAGEFQVDRITYYAISAETPIGKLLLGKEVGDKLEFRKKSMLIKEII